MADLFGIGVSGVRTHQEALAITGQNITNANTPGYSRQRVEIDAQFGSLSAERFDGAGSRVTSVTRLADEFVTRQMRNDQSLYSQMDTLARQLQQVESIFFGEVAGIDQAVTQFFGALNSANASPASLPDRQVVLNEAGALADRFGSVHARLQQQFETLDGLLSAGLERVNEIALGVGELNARISSLQTENRAGALNSLLDQRDLLLQELSQHFNVSVVEADTGQVNVFIGKGQPMVLGARASVLGLDVAGQVTLETDSASGAERVTSSLSGGELGGLLEFRDRVLTGLMNDVGVLAAGVTQSVNNAHQEGLDLQGAFGAQLFRDLNDPGTLSTRITADTNNRPNTSVDLQLRIDDPSALTGSDYSLEFSDVEEGVFLVRRLSDNQLITQGLITEGVAQEIEFDGVTLEVGAGEYFPGDQYLITPVRDLAAQFDVVLEDASSLALASPVRIEGDPGNSGSAVLQVGLITDRENPFFNPDGELVPPLRVVFTSSETYDILDASDPLAPQQLDPPLRGLSYTPGLLNELLPADGTTLVQSFGTAVGALPSDPVVTTGIVPVSNGYPTGSIALQYQDADTGSLLESRTITFPAGASAREIADELSAQSGVTARAHTEMVLTGLRNDDAGTPLEVVVNGVTISGVTSLNELADAITANAGLAGIRARSDGERLTLEHLTGEDLSIHVSGDPTDGVTALGPNGAELNVNGVAGGNYQSISVGGSVVVQMDAGISMTASADGLFTSSPTAVPADFGWSLEMRGVPSEGDAYDVSFNSDAVSDNRNGVRLAELANARVLGDPPRTFTSAYSSIVLDVGSRQSEASVQRDAAQALLDQSTATRESISGVNLDEEAANLIRLEQAYNASAQVINVARDIFNVLFDAVR